MKKECDERAVRYSPNMVNMCMDFYDGEMQEGRLYHPYTAEAVSFSSLLGALAYMERLYDRLQFPQAATRIRNFQKNRREKERQRGKEIRKRTEFERREIRELETFDHVTEQRGKDATFLIRVKYRQNSSWQGEVTWVDGHKKEYFRSALELIRLIDSAMNKG